jgi:hypothetical protein
MGDRGDRSWNAFANMAPIDLSTATLEDWRLRQEMSALRGRFPRNEMHFDTTPITDQMRVCTGQKLPMSWSSRTRTIDVSLFLR